MVHPNPLLQEQGPALSQSNFKTPFYYSKVQDASQRVEKYLQSTWAFKTPSAYSDSDN